MRNLCGNEHLYSASVPPGQSTAPLERNKETGSATKLCQVSPLLLIRDFSTNLKKAPYQIKNTVFFKKPR